MDTLSLTPQTDPHLLYVCMSVFPPQGDGRQRGVGGGACRGVGAGRGDPHPAHQRRHQGKPLHPVSLLHHLSTQCFTHSLTHSYSPKCQLTHALTHLPAHMSSLPHLRFLAQTHKHTLHLYTHSLLNSSITYLFTCLFTHFFTHQFTPSPTHSSTPSTHTSTRALASQLVYVFSHALTRSHGLTPPLSALQHTPVHLPSTHLCFLSSLHPSIS